MEEYKEEWLIPESDKYYKGYRYKKDSLGHEHWFDENNIQRKVIGYYFNNNKKHYEVYRNENGQLHKEDGYAMQEWNRNGNIKKQEYWLNDEKLTEQEWKEKITNKRDEISIEGFENNKDTLSVGDEFTQWVNGLK